jgi:hypothetical protein
MKSPHEASKFANNCHYSCQLHAGVGGLHLASRRTLRRECWYRGIGRLSRMVTNEMTRKGCEDELPIARSPWNVYVAPHIYTQTLWAVKCDRYLS